MMKIDRINPSFDFGQGSASDKNNGVDFGKFFKDALDSVNDSQLKADENDKKVITGEIDVQDAMISAEEARIQMELVMQIRNKLVESYQEISRMQV